MSPTVLSTMVVNPAEIFRSTTTTNSVKRIDPIHSPMMTPKTVRYLKTFSDNFPTPAGSKCQFLNFPPRACGVVRACVEYVADFFKTRAR
jgi:hypothetical protein